MPYCVGKRSTPSKFFGFAGSNFSSVSVYNVTRSLISVPGMCNGCVFVRKGFDVLQEITFTRAFKMKGFLTTALVLIGLNMQL